MTKFKRTASAMGKPIPTTSRRTRQQLDREPTAAELAAIDAEWPLIAAELAVVDAEITLFCSPHEPTELDWRRLHRVHDLVRQRAAEVAKPATARASRSSRTRRAA